MVVVPLLVLHNSNQFFSPNFLCAETSKRLMFNLTIFSLTTKFHSVCKVLEPERASVSTGYNAQILHMITLHMSPRKWKTINARQPLNDDV